MTESWAVWGMPTVQRDRRPFLFQSLRNGQADTCSRAGYQGRFSGQL